MKGKVFGMRLAAALLLLSAVLAAMPPRLCAETISWSAVTTYTDGTPIEPTRTVAYDIYWTSDAGLSTASLRTIASSVAGTSATFDPDVQGMPRGQTVYFTGNAVLNTGERSALASAYSWTVPVVSPPPGTPTLTAIAVSGPASVNEGGSGAYTATATWSDGSTTNVTPTWTVSPTAYASIGSSGVLTALLVTSNQSVTVSASYSSGGMTRSATQAVAIVDAGDVALVAPANVAVNGPVTTAPSKEFQVKWDPVTSRLDGSSIPAGSLRYDAVWTTDTSASIDTWRPLASSTSSTSVTFDPNSAGMPRNQRVYFSIKAKDSSGDTSPPSEIVSWIANNQGPSPPKNGQINKK